MSKFSIITIKTVKIHKTISLSALHRTILLLLFIGLNLSSEAQQVDSDYAQTADTLLANHLRNHGISFSHDNSVVLLQTGQEKFDDLFTAIRQAKKSVHLEYFNFRNDSIAKELFDILAERADAGVEIRALFDSFGNMSNNRPLHRRHIQDIRSRGIEIYEVDPIRFPWVNHVFSRDHRKIVVIDGKIAYIGGMNVADYYITGTPQVGQWHDMHCRIEGTEVNTLQSIFLKIWNRVTKQDIYGAQYYRGLGDVSYFHGLKPDTCPSAGKKMIGIINREPRKTNSIIRDFYTNAIQLAKDSIRIINPYFTLNHSLKKALRDAVKRGVKVDIMLSTRSDIPLTPDAGFYNAHQLMQDGCNIWMFTKGFHHTKVIMVDGRICTVGSANLNARSLSWDYEANAVILDKCTTHELNKLFDREKSSSFLLTPKNWKEWRSPWKRFAGWFGHILAPVL